MTETLDCDLKKLQALAFDRMDCCADIVRRYHAVRPQLAPDDAPALRALYRWLLVPIGLWPFNVQDVLADALARAEQGRPLPRRHRLIAELLPEPPGDTVCAAVTDHEHQVWRGSYEKLVNTQAKYDQNELAVKADPELRRQWARLKAAFPIQDYCDRKGVIRRRMAVERNLHESFSVNLRKRGEAFQAAFDAFCLRWNLYGMLRDEPLPLKLAVNLTPYGTMIHIPAYWSFDPKRDIRWEAIAALHRVRVPGRQGVAIAENQAQRRRDAAKLRQLDQEVLRLGLKGDKKHEYLCAGLGWVSGTSAKRIHRLRNGFKPKSGA